MAYLREKCPDCGKVATLDWEKPMGEKYVQKLSCCGKLSISERSFHKPPINPCWKAAIGPKVAYQFQQDGIDFISRTGYNCIVADAMGLGKTIQALLAARNNPDLYPALIVVPASTIYQWYGEHEEWINHSIPCLIASGASPVFPGFQFYIISHDLIGRKGMPEKLASLGIKLLIVDEIHKFKDDDAKRTIGLFKFCKLSSVKHKILLSGTPIKNRADEWFTGLNLVAPLHFPYKRQFQYRWLEQDDKGHYSRVLPYRKEAFSNLISEFVIRREKREVLTDLPVFTRNLKTFTLEVDESLRREYNHELDALEELLNSGRYSTIGGLGHLARLRRIEGICKISSCVEHVNEFLENTDDEKIAIGIHHIAVRDGLYHALRQWKPLKLSGEDSPEQKDRVRRLFNDPNSGHRVLIVNILAGGTGLNLQEACANCIILERCWNFADEKQFEDRFDRNGQTKPVVADYLVAKNFVDDYFSKMVEEKRANFLATLDASDDTAGNYQFSQDASAIKDLCEQVTKGRL